MKKTIGILAHVDAGKTTLAEQLLYNTHRIRTRGRVDDGDTVLDTDAVERQRGITVFSDIACFPYRESLFYLVDTPGHIDFAAEMERVLPVLDYAVLVISSVEGVQGHTETVWELLREYRVPVFFFINKTDRVGADPQGVLRTLKSRFSPDIIDFKTEYTEKVAELREDLLALYLEDRVDEALWAEAAVRAIRERELFLCFCGSALNNEGVDAFLAALDRFTVTQFDEAAPFAGRVFKIRYDKQGNRLTLLKITGGTLHVRDRFGFAVEDETVYETVHEIRRYTGAKYEQVQALSAGDVCAVTGLRYTQAGTVIGGTGVNIRLKTTPMLVARVWFDESIPLRTVLEKFRLLEEEDPLLGVQWNEALQELRVHIMGTVQLEILQAVCAERFGLQVQFGACEVLYQETIRNTVIGCGHFEPLKHYAEVHLQLAPLPRGSGIVFRSACPQDVLDKSYQNLIRTHVFEKTHTGVLANMPITDLEITLLTGRAHLKHTHGGDFREAVYRAIRQGLCKAESVLLEPLYRFSITVPGGDLGRVLADVQKMCGTFEAPETMGGTAMVRGTLPVSEAMDYAKELLAFTKGSGRISTAFGGYAECHDTAAVLEKIGYDPARDRENSADSVFCSHGSGFVVKWQEADGYMHCRLD